MHAHACLFRRAHDSVIASATEIARTVTWMEMSSGAKDLRATVVELPAAGATRPSLQPLFNSLAIASARFELLAVGKTKEELAVIQRNEFSDSGSLHDG